MTPFHSLVRDVELISTRLSSRLSPSIRPPSSLVAWYHPCEENVQPLPLFDHIISKICMKPDDNLMLEYSGTRIESIAIHSGLLSLHESMYLSDTGLRMKYNGKWTSWSEMAENERIVYGPELLEIVSQLWKRPYDEIIVRVDEDLTEMPKFVSVIANERMEEVKRFIEGLELRKKYNDERLGNVDDPPEEEEIEWRVAAIENLESQIADAEKSIEKMDHCLNNFVTVILRRKEGE